MPNKPQDFIARPDHWLWDMLDSPGEFPAGWFQQRFALLQQALQSGEFRRDAAIVPLAADRSKLTAVEIDGGRDVKYVVVYARAIPPDWRPGIQETLTYRSDVAGTDLIYDLTGEFLQGKARPFVGDLRQLPLRVYAVLPFQVETIDFAAQQRIEISSSPIPAADRPKIFIDVRLRFLEASGTPIRGRLPYHVAVHGPDGKRQRGDYRVTDERGQTLLLELAAWEGTGKLVARSLLTGEELTLPVEIVSGGVASPRNAMRLTSQGLSSRRAPQPVQPSGL